MTTKAEEDQWVNAWVHNGDLGHSVDLATKAGRIIHQVLFHQDEIPPIGNHPGGRTVIVKDAWDILGPDRIREIILDHLRSDDHKYNSHY